LVNSAVPGKQNSKSSRGVETTVVEELVPLDLETNHGDHDDDYDNDDYNGDNIEVDPQPTTKYDSDDDDIEVDTQPTTGDDHGNDVTKVAPQPSTGDDHDGDNSDHEVQILRESKRPVASQNKRPKLILSLTERQNISTPRKMLTDESINIAQNLLGSQFPELHGNYKVQTSANYKGVNKLR